MARLLWIVVLLVLTVELNAARSYRILKEVSLHKEELSHRYGSHRPQLWRLFAKRDDSSEADAYNCDEVIPCLQTLLDDFENADKSKISVQQCSDVIDTFAACVEAKVANGSLCESCPKKVQVRSLLSAYGSETAKGFLCGRAPTTEELALCSATEQQCAATCQEGQDDSRMMRRCVRCLDEWSDREMETGLSKCPLLLPFREKHLTMELDRILSTAIHVSDCSKTDVQDCEPNFNGVDCSSATSVKAAVEEQTQCLAELATNDSKCKSLAKVANIFKKKGDLMIRLPQRECRAMQLVENECGDKKKRFLAMLQRVLDGDWE